MSIERTTSKISSKWVGRLWDSWCALSLIGIWPRWVEPAWTRISRQYIELDGPLALPALSIVHLSDLHFHSQVSNRFLDAIVRKIKKISPDLIFFTGDWICRSHLEDSARLLNFLQALKAPLGNFCVLGNHDGMRYVTAESDGTVRVTDERFHWLERIGRSLFAKRSYEKRTQPVLPLPELVELLAKSPFVLLDNQTIQLPLEGGKLNITGIGDLWSGQADVNRALSQHDPAWPSIMLAHNPDTISLLDHMPPSLLLSGHHHGGQVNFPGLWRIFSWIEHPRLKRGYYKYRGKQVYVSRGLGDPESFRWGAFPEIAHIVLKFQTEHEDG